ncbi:hypothetical protein TIFTF001_050545 [Ficus carica]|uniref:Uncharacterized protein n=1 Tax=Ficus carica TaxID=3494 RepID=A0AA87ZLA9_FICCA|nr:hypothetical protein TIFTF001_050545 [Ficus carica]
MAAKYKLIPEIAIGETGWSAKLELQETTGELALTLKAFYWQRAGAAVPSEGRLEQKWRRAGATVPHFPAAAPCGDVYSALLSWRCSAREACYSAAA